VKLIPVSRNKFAQIDNDDFELISKYRWYENEVYAVTYHKGKRIKMHRLIMKAKPGQPVNHKDNNKLNYQKYNLRFCTTAQNNRNGVLRKDNTSGYKGVSLEPSTGHWRPNIYKDGVAISFGN
jgi:hypothetical protein